MRATTATYKQIIASGKTRNFLVTVNMTLADDTSLTITEENIMQGSFKILSASSGTDSFDIGSAIIGKCQFTLNNYNDTYTQYDFFNATAVVWVGLVGDLDENETQVYNRMGFFTVDEPTFAGSLVSLELLDNMWKFDVPLSEANLSYPITALSAVNTICSHCGVQLATQDFHGKNFSIAKAPENDINCREMLQYIAMIGCNFCIIDDEGYLRIKWYTPASYISSELDGGTFDTNTTPYSDGDSADGGNFTTYTGGDSYDGGSFYEGSTASFTRLMTRNIGTDDIAITGVKFIIGETEHRIGTTGYVLELENPLVDATNVNTVLNLIWDVLDGFTIRTFNVTALPDLAPEVGDYCAISYKGSMVYSHLTNYTFTPSLSTASLGAVTPTRTLTKRYSKVVQAAVEEARKQAEDAISDYDLAVQIMNDLAVSALGGYEDYEDLPTGGRVWYLSNKPITKVGNVCSFETGSTVFKKTGSGFFVSTDGGQTWVNGYNAQTGQLVVNVLNAIGISADWIKTGLLNVGGRGTAATILVKDATQQENEIVRVDSNGVTMSKGVIQSADYSYTSGTYSDSGMIIDLINTYLRSTAFELTNSGGHIGAAEFDEDSLQIVGNIALYDGSGTFKFRPTDYYIATDFSLLLKTESGTATVTVVRHSGGSDHTVGTYTATTAGVETAELNHNIGTNKEDYYKVTCSARCSVSIENAYLAYMGQTGFKGTLEGIFRGYLESYSGILAGLEYDNGGTFYGSSASLTNRSGYSGSASSLLFNGGGSSTLPTITRSYLSGGSTETEEVTWGNRQKFIDQVIDDPPVAAGEEGDLVFSGLGGTSLKKMFRYESNAWTQVLFDEFMSHFEISTVDIGEGVPLDPDKFYLVYEP